LKKEDKELKLKVFMSKTETKNLAMTFTITAKSEK